MKGARGGRGSGKSHFFAESVVEAHVLDPDFESVMIREVQKSLRFSAKKLIEQKIQSLGVGHLFDVMQNEIRHRNGKGIMIFQGMQDHTADSIKSLEAFDLAWVEEAQNISARSMELLLPTFRKSGSQIWFSWNPDDPSDPVEQLVDDMVCVHVNYYDNPFCPQEIINEAERHLRRKPETFDHVWLGGYNVRNEASIFLDHYRVEEFEPSADWEPLHGLDWGFSTDPTAALRVYYRNGYVFIYQEAGGVGLELDKTAKKLEETIPNIGKYVIRADSARPESISYCRRNGLPKITAVEKWSGSVEDGIEWIKSTKGVIIHPQCRETIDEFRLYSYKIHKQTGEILPDIVDKNNHYIDALRYALAPLIRQTEFIFE